MKLFLAVFFLPLSIIAEAGTQVYMFGKIVSLPGECVYYERTLNEGGFSCKVDSESYELKFLTVEAAEQHYALVESDIEEDAESRLFKDRIRDLSHYYFHLKKGDLEGFFYTVCSPNECFTALSLDRGILKKVLGYFEIDLIENM